MPDVSYHTLIHSLSLSSPETFTELALLYPAIGTITGAFFGAMPIPLDWGRPWQ